jgi:hypothetical protein
MFHLFFPAITMFTARLRKTGVRNKETTYMCQTFKFPADERHMIAFKPVIDNARVVHHMVVFGCRGDCKFSNHLPFYFHIKISMRYTREGHYVMNYEGYFKI